MQRDIRGFPFVSSELDYVERTTQLSVTATSAATAEAWITGNSIYVDGATKIKIEAWAYFLDITVSNQVLLELYDFDTDLGRLGLWSSNSGTLSAGTPYASRVFTPTAGNHKYSIRAWKTGGTANFYAAAGGANTGLPAWYRVTRT
jgi:hypothetical protein